MIRMMFTSTYVSPVSLSTKISCVWLTFFAVNVTCSNVSRSFRWAVMVSSSKLDPFTFRLGSIIHLQVLPFWRCRCWYGRALFAQRYAFYWVLLLLLFQNYYYSKICIDIEQMVECIVLVGHQFPSYFFIRLFKHKIVIQQSLWNSAER